MSIRNALCLVAVAAVGVGCSSGPSVVVEDADTGDTDGEAQTETGEEESFSYSGPGSYWEAHFDAPSGTFAITMAEMPSTPTLMTVEGTYTDANGFKVLTVDSASGQDAPAAGDQALGLEIPGYAFLLLPMDEKHDGIIPMLVSGGCPTADQSLNWLIAQGYADRDATATDREFLGTYAYSLANNSAVLPSRYALAGLTQQAAPNETIQPGSCTGSVLTIEHGQHQQPIADMWMTNDGAMVRTYDGDANQTILALPGRQVAAADVAGDYVGFHFTSAASQIAGEPDAMAESMPVTLSIDGSGQGTGAVFADVGAGTLGPEQVSISLPDVNVPSDGWVTGHIQGVDGTGALACAAATGIGVAAQSILFCIGQNPSDPTRAFTLMLASN